jgi:hypothetical protein
VAHVIRAFNGCEESQCRRDQLADLIEAAWARRAKKRYQFGKGLFDGIEVGAIRRQESEVRAGCFNRGANRGLLVDREVVQHDDIAWAECRQQHLLDVGAEHGRVHRAIEHGGGGESVEAQAHDDGVRLPVAAGRVVLQTCPARAAAIPTQQIRRHATFIEKDVVAHIAQRLPRPPLASGGGDVRPALFVSEYGFF